MKYPKWFPYPSAWLDALLLSFLAGTIANLSDTFSETVLSVSKGLDNPEPLILFYIASVFAPIPVVAIVHHVLNLVLRKTKSKTPELLSWWEGLWCWMVIAVSTLAMLSIGILSYRLFGVSQMDLILSSQLMRQSSESDRFFLFIGIVWLVIAAYLFQVHHLTRKLFESN